MSLGHHPYTFHMSGLACRCFCKVVGKHPNLVSRLEKFRGFLSVVHAPSLRSASHTIWKVLGSHH